MADSNSSLDFSNLVNLLQNQVHPVEDRQNKNELFKAFLSEVLSATLQSPVIKNIGEYSFEIRDVNITEEFESLVAFCIFCTFFITSSIFKRPERRIFPWR